MQFSPVKKTFRIRHGERHVTRRKHQRYPANWPARCVAESQLDCDVIIENASEGGFGLSCSLPLEVNARIVLTIDQIGVFPCRLAWKSDDKCGVQLLTEEGHLTMDQIAGLSGVLGRDKY